MTDLTDAELAILKQLHDEVIRPVNNMAGRMGLGVDVVEKSLRELNVKGLVEERHGPKWKITYDGKIALASERLKKAEEKGVFGVAAEQEQRLLKYYDHVLEQARQSFWLALSASIVGLLFFLGAAAFVMLNKGTDAAMVSVVSGALVELIAGVNFYLYGKTTSQLSLFHGRLDITQRFLLANSLCESLEGELKEKTRSTLILTLADAASPDFGETGE